MKTLKNLDIQPGLRVLLRVDINEPVDSHGIPQSTFRLERVLPTIQYLREKHARIILMAHLGNPGGENVAQFRFDYMAKELSRLGGFTVQKLDSITGAFAESQAESLEPGEVLLLENLRFDKREEQNSDAFALELSRLGEIYVNDSFSVSHRSHTSTVAITKYLPSYAGFLLTEEVEILSEVLHNPTRPAIAIVGGAKISTKLPVIKALQKQFDYVLVGGKIANEYLDLYGKSQIPNVLFPVDFTGESRYDIGPKTIEQFTHYISLAKTIVWNGPLGFIERKPYDKGTLAIATAIANNPDVYSIVGGGETVDEIHQLNKDDKIDFISTGGGAMLSFIATDGILPVLMMLNESEI